jgi:transposase
MQQRQEAKKEVGQKVYPLSLQLALTAVDLHETGKYIISDIAKMLQMPIATCYRYINYVKRITVN